MKPRFALSVLTLMGISQSALLAGPGDAAYATSRVVYVAPMEEDEPDAGQADPVSLSGLEWLADMAELGLLTRATPELYWKMELHDTDAPLSPQNTYTRTYVDEAALADNRFVQAVLDVDQPVNNGFAAARRNARRLPASVLFDNAVRNVLAYDLLHPRGRRAAGLESSTPSPYAGGFRPDLPVGLTAPVSWTFPCAPGYSGTCVSAGQPYYFHSTPAYAGGAPRPYKTAVKAAAAPSPVSGLPAESDENDEEGKKDNEETLPLVQDPTAGNLPAPMGEAPVPMSCGAYAAPLPTATAPITTATPTVALAIAESPAPVVSTGVVSSDSHITSTTQLPSSAPVQYIDNALTVTPSNTPGWTEGTPLFDSNVYWLRRNTANGSFGLTIDGEDQARWVMEQGLATANSNKYFTFISHISGNSATGFQIINLHDRKGDANTPFGITSASGVNGNHTLYITNNGYIYFQNNTREIAADTVNAASSGLINVKGAVTFNSNTCVFLRYNKFISTEGVRNRSMSGGLICSGSNLFFTGTVGYTMITGNEVVLGDAEGCNNYVRGGVAYTDYNGVSFKGGKYTIAIQLNSITKTGTSDAQEISGGVFYTRFLQMYDNTASAIYIEGNGINVEGANSTCRGGFACVTWDAEITFPGPTYHCTGDSVFTNNSGAIRIASNYINSAGGTSKGGAIYAEGMWFEWDDGTPFHYLASIKITDNKQKVSILSNTATGTIVRGGAICAEEAAPIVISGNPLVEVGYNAIGGVTAGDDLKGGAIYFAHAADSIKISGNEQVVFQGNAEISYDGTVRLRSVYADLTETNASAFEWSAPDGGYIMVADSITLVNNAETNKQLCFNKAGGVKTTGTLLFSGETTKDDLAHWKEEGVAPTDAEIEASRTSEIEGATVKMESGTLQIEDGARLQIHGKTEADSSEFNSMDVVLAAGDLVIQGSEKTYVDNTVLKLARSQNGNGLTSHLIGTSASAAGPTLVVTNGLNIEIYNEESADHTDAFLAVDGFNLDLTGPVNLAIVDSELSDPDMRYDLFDFSQAGTGWEDLFGHLGETFTINGEEFSTEKYLHYDAGTGKLFYQENMPKPTVPEPATSILAASALAALAARRRRKG